MSDIERPLRGWAAESPLTCQDRTAVRVVTPRLAFYSAAPPLAQPAACEHPVKVEHAVDGGASTWGFGPHDGGLPRDHCRRAPGVLPHLSHHTRGVPAPPKRRQTSRSPRQETPAAAGSASCAKRPLTAYAQARGLLAAARPLAHRRMPVRRPSSGCERPRGSHVTPGRRADHEHGPVIDAARLAPSTFSADEVPQPVGGVPRLLQPQLGPVVSTGRCECDRQGRFIQRADQKARVGRPCDEPSLRA